MPLPQLLPELGALWRSRIEAEPEAVFAHLAQAHPHVAWLEDAANGIQIIAGADDSETVALADLEFDERLSIGWVPYEAGLALLGLPGDAPTQWLRPTRWAVVFDGTVELQSTGEPWQLPELSTPAAVADSRIQAEPLDTDAEYAQRVRTSLEWIRAGDSYLVCLTGGYRATGVDAVATYLALRAANPDHRGGFVRIGDRALASISPERFLTVADGVAATEPIKGTRRRDPDPVADAALARELADSEKERAENVMIVDLCRNDLHPVCEVGTVAVRGLLRVETYAPVHQLVSTVHGRLLPDASVADALRALFPAGSMTGAPKRRTVELLQGLEGRERGLYSGCFGAATSTWASLAMTIRAVVVDGDEAHIGVGGGITALSIVDEEVAEMRLKARALLAALRG